MYDSARAIEYECVYVRVRVFLREHCDEDHEQ